MTLTVRILLALTVVVVLAGVPLFVGAAGQGILTRMLIAALFATGYNLLLGQAGLLSFGHAAFYGVGAIATMHAMIAIERGSLVLPLPFVPLVGAFAGLVLALITGFFATKRSGTYFALVTLAMAELIHVIAPMWQAVFGGESGLTSMRMPAFGFSFDAASQVYILTLLWVIAGIGFLWLLSQTAFGQLALALKGNEQRLKFLGFNTYFNKVLVFAISGTIAGLAGSLLSISTESASYTLFAPDISVQVVFYTFIGGSAFFLGPAVAAAVLVFLPYQLSNYTYAWPLYQGLLFMVVMLTTPHGITGLIKWPEDQGRGTYDRLRAAKRLLIGILLVGTTAVCVETMLKIGRSALIGMLPQSSLAIWALAGVLGIVLLLIFRRMTARRQSRQFSADESVKSPGV